MRWPSAPICSAGNRIAIIGGGFIGLELAAAARKLGAAVTVIEAQPRILMRGVPAEIAEIIHEAHVAEGVDILCGEGIASIADDGTASARDACRRTRNHQPISPSSASAPCR